MKTLRTIMKIDDPDFEDDDAGPFKFTNHNGQIGCFVLGNFGFTYEERSRPENFYYLCPTNTALWPTYKDKALSFITTSELALGGTDYKLGVSGRTISDNEYQIPTRILLTRYDVDADDQAKECYVNFKIPVFLEGMGHLQQAQLVLDAWYSLVSNYLTSIDNVYEFIQLQLPSPARSAATAGQDWLGNWNVHNPSASVQEREYATLISKYVAIRSNVNAFGKFPNFYNRYRYALGRLDQARTPVIDANDHLQYFSREKLLTEVCNIEIEQGSYNFANRENILKELFKDRGLLLKKDRSSVSQVVEARNSADGTSDIPQYLLDSTRLAGAFYNIDPRKAFASSYTESSWPARMACGIAVSNLIRWFQQRRFDSLWGITYTGPEKVPNLKIETPGILCGKSPFVSDGRCSLSELKACFLAITENIKNMYTGPSNNEHRMEQISRVYDLYSSIIGSARGDLERFLRENNFNLDDLSPKGSFRETHVFKCMFGLSDLPKPYKTAPIDEPWRLGEYKQPVSQYIYQSEAAGQIDVTFRGAETRADNQHAGQEFEHLYIGNIPKDEFSSRALVSEPSLVPNNTPIAFFLGSFDNFYPFTREDQNDPLELIVDLTQHQRNLLSEYEITYQQPGFAQSPFHYLNIIGIDFSSHPWARDLLSSLKPVDALNININGIETDVFNANINIGFGIGNRVEHELYGIGAQKQCIVMSLISSTYMRTMSKGIFERYLVTQDMAEAINSVYNRQLGEAGINSLVSNIYHRVSGQEEELEQEIFNMYFRNTEIMHGIRMMLCVPGESEGSLDLKTIPEQFDQSFTRLFDEQRLGATVDNSGRELETYMLANFEEIMAFDDPCWNITSLQSLERRFNSLADHRFERIQEEEDFQVYLGYLFPVNRFMSTAAIYNTTLLGSYNTFPILFRSTKNMLGTMFYEAIKKIMNGDSFNDNNLQDFGLETVDNASIFDSLAKNARPGSSGRDDCDLFPVDFSNWINMLADMLEEFILFIPSMILRGIANQIDPAYREMKHHWNSCNLDGFSFTGSPKDGRGDPLKFKTLDRELQLGVDKRQAGLRKQEGQYAPVNVAFPVDLVTGVFTMIAGIANRPKFKRGVRYTVASLDKFVTYLYAGSLPFFDPSWAFQIPCVNIDEAGDTLFDWEGFRAGSKGRYGHSITPFTLLALATPVMRRDAKEQRFRCKIEATDGISNTAGRSDLEEC